MRALPWIVWGFVRRRRKRLVATVMRRAHGAATRLDGVRTRDQTPGLLNRLGLLGTAVEVGVKRALRVHATDGRPHAIERFPSWLEIPR